MDISGDELLDAMRVAVDLLADSDPRELDGRDAARQLLELEKLAGRITTLAARRIAVVEADGFWAVDGARTLTSWVSASGRMSYPRAAALVRLGRSLARDLPLTSEAASQGEIGIDHANAMARHTTNTKLRREALAAPADECGEEFLVDHAKAMGADSFARLVRRWSAAADPGADDRGFRKDTERENFTLSPTTNGVHLSGFLTTENGATLSAALDAVMGAPAAGDTRTTAQRRGQALTDLARLVLEQGVVGTGSAVRPHLTCVVDYDSLMRAVRRAYPDDTSRGESSFDPTRQGMRLQPVSDEERFAVGEILGSGPIPDHVLARLACDSEITRVVFGPQSQVINVGRAERTFSGPRRRAIVARDGTCRYPDCGAPPALGELHHVDHWARDHGDSDANRGILLCWYHHALVHRLGIEITRSPTGGWTFTTRSGSEVPAAA